MATRTPPFHLILASEAARDILEILDWSAARFGERAASRYLALMEQALLDLSADPERRGARHRVELREQAWTYHLRYSRDRVRNSRKVAFPRHFLLYRLREDRVVEVARVLHDASDLDRHLPEDYDAEFT